MLNNLNVIYESDDIKMTYKSTDNSSVNDLFIDKKYGRFFTNSKSTSYLRSNIAATNFSNVYNTAVESTTSNILDDLSFAKNCIEIERKEKLVDYNPVCFNYRYGEYTIYVLRFKNKMVRIIADHHQDYLCSLNPNSHHGFTDGKIGTSTLSSRFASIVDDNGCPTKFEKNSVIIYKNREIYYCVDGKYYISKVVNDNKIYLKDTEITREDLLVIVNIPNTF